MPWPCGTQPYVINFVYIIYCSQLLHKWTVDLSKFHTWLSLTDSFYYWNRTDSSNTTVTCCDRTNIAWRTDLDIRFQNPGGSDYFTQSDGTGTVMPPFWLRNLSNLAGVNSTTDKSFPSAGLRNESLIVWFRVSAFPWFRKLYGRLWVDGVLGGELPAGNYSVTLTYSILQWDWQLLILVFRLLIGPCLRVCEWRYCLYDLEALDTFWCWRQLMSPLVHVWVVQLASCIRLVK